MLLVGSALKGYAIEATDGQLGTVSDLLFDDTTWKLRWIVVDTGTWLPGRKVLIAPSAVGEAEHSRQVLAVRLTRVQVQESPDIVQDAPVTQQMQNDLYDYYGWDPLFGGSVYGAGSMASPLVPAPFFGTEASREMAGFEGRLTEGDPHLRSIEAVKGYHIHASDGDIGHVESFLVDDAHWNIRYLIVDTSNWWIGRHVLISPYAVRHISYDDQTVSIDLSRDLVKASPAWDPAEVIDRLYEQRLHRHYSWPGYGW